MKNVTVQYFEKKTRSKKSKLEVTFRCNPKIFIVMYPLTTIYLVFNFSMDYVGHTPKCFSFSLGRKFSLLFLEFAY